MTSDEVRVIREKLRLTRKELAQQLAVPYETLCRWENGNRSPSKSYEAKLRQLSGSTPSQRDEHWIFLSSNLRRVRHVVAQTRGLVLGTVHALVDPSNQFFLARIRLRPDVASMNDLEQYFSTQTRREMRTVGFFAAGDGNICPTKHILQFMVSLRGIDHCVLFTRGRQIMTVWRLCSPWPPSDISIKNPWAHAIGHYVVGGADDIT